MISTEIEIVPFNEGITYLSFLVTMAMTSSCRAALSRNVTIVADGFDILWYSMELAYTCRKRKECTGLFHFRANSSHVVEFHQSS